MHNLEDIIERLASLADDMLEAGGGIMNLDAAVARAELTRTLKQVLTGTVDVSFGRSS